MHWTAWHCVLYPVSPVTARFLGWVRAKKLLVSRFNLTTEHVDRHMVWYGTVRYGTVRYGIARHCTVRYGIVLYGASHGTLYRVQYGTCVECRMVVRYGTVWNGIVLYMIWCMIRYIHGITCDMVRYFVVWHGMARCDICTVWYVMVHTWYVMVHTWYVMVHAWYAMVHAWYSTW